MTSKDARNELKNDALSVTFAGDKEPATVLTKTVNKYRRPYV